MRERFERFGRQVAGLLPDVLHLGADKVPKLLDVCAYPPAQYLVLGARILFLGDETQLLVEDGMFGFAEPVLEVLQRFLLVRL